MELLQLGKLVLVVSSAYSFSSSDASDSEYVSAADVCSIACCCPNLEELQLDYVLMRGSLGGLSEMPALKQLSVTGAAFDDAAAGYVAQSLTGLQSLAVERGSLTRTGLRALSARKGHTRLTLDECPRVMQVLTPSSQCDRYYEDYSFELTHTVSRGCASLC